MLLTVCTSACAKPFPKLFLAHFNYFWHIFLAHFYDNFFDVFLTKVLTYNLLTIVSFRIRVPSILFLPVKECVIHYYLCKYVRLVRSSFYCYFKSALQNSHLSNKQKLEKKSLMFQCSSFEIYFKKVYLICSTYK